MSTLFFREGAMELPSKDLLVLEAGPENGAGKVIYLRFCV